MHIASVQPNLLGGAFRAPVQFSPDINVLSGENGTGKTQLLSSLKAGTGIELAGDGDPGELRVIAISPKRNAERKSIDVVLTELRQQDKRLTRVLEQFRSQALTDNTFVAYPTLGELYFLAWEDACGDGGDRREHMRRTTTDFNRVISQIFPGLKLLTEWTEHRPGLTVKKGESMLQVTQLSCGEQEVLSLALNLHLHRTSQDVILIDEPEIHLNWHLERSLFQYLLGFSEGNGPQLIVATHSRIVFQPDWLPRTRFLIWDDGSVVVSERPSGELRERIAGEVLQMVGLGDFPVATFFVEDDTHVRVVTEIAESLKRRVSVVPLGNSSNVRSLYRVAAGDGGWENAYFLWDGDGQGNPFPGAAEVIHLDRYCMENYLLSPAAFCHVSGWTEAKFRSEVVRLVKKNRSKILHQNKFLGFLVDRLKTSDIKNKVLAGFDASELLPDLLKAAGKKRTAFIRAYVRRLGSQGQLRRVFPSSLIEAIQSSPPT